MHNRERVKWSPVWEGPTEDWAKGFIRKNKWRCDHIHDFKDLLQDAYLVFLRIAEKYPRIVDQGAFMALYRAAMMNHMHDHARYMRRKHEQHQETPVDVSELYSGRIGDLTNDGYLSILIKSAPTDLRSAIICLLENPPSLHRRNGHRENLNMKLVRIIGCDESIDLTGGIRQLLGS